MLDPAETICDNDATVSNEPPRVRKQTAKQLALLADAKQGTPATTVTCKPAPTKKANAVASKPAALASTVTAVPSTPTPSKTPTAVYSKPVPVDCEQCTNEIAAGNPGVREIVTIRGLGLSGTLFFCNDLCLHNYEEARKTAAVLAQNLVQTLVTPFDFQTAEDALDEDNDVLSSAEPVKNGDAEDGRRTLEYSVLRPAAGWQACALKELQTAVKERKIPGRSRKITGDDGKKQNPGKQGLVNLLNTFETGVPVEQPVLNYWTNNSWARLASCMTEPEIREEVLRMYDCATREEIDAKDATPKKMALAAICRLYTDKEFVVWHPDPADSNVSHMNPNAEGVHDQAPAKIEEKIALLRRLFDQVYANWNASGSVPYIDYNNR